VPLGFADTVTLTLMKPGVPFEQLNRLRQEKMVVYLIAEMYGKDEVGPLPQSQACWFISPDDWNRPSRCTGHNSFE
jgi:hypothetical protein